MKKGDVLVARFKGKNSLGYEKGKEYALKFKDKLTISRMNGMGVCPYTSLKAFFKNWDVVNE
jgi:hypothetical protein